MGQEHEPDILNELAADERRLRVARHLPKDGKLKPDDIINVLNDCRAIIQRYGVKFRQISSDLGKGYSQSVISQILKITCEGDIDRAYDGDIDDKVRAINNWNERYVRAQETARPKADFIETSVARKILTLISNAIEYRKIGLVCGPSGVGKTMTLQAAHQKITGSIYIRIDSSTTSVSALRHQIKDELKISRVRNAREIQQAIYKVLNGTDRVIIIDEAHKLDLKAVDLLRDIYDVCNVPVVLSGTIDILSKTNDANRFFGQFTSRTGLFYNVDDDIPISGNDKPLFSIDEIKECFIGDKIRFTADGLQALYELANVPGHGCLRLCNGVVKLAAKIAQGKPIDAKLIKRSREQLLDKGTNRTIAHAMNTTGQGNRKAVSA